MTHFKNSVYRWRGINKLEQEISGEIIALSLNLAVANLLKNGITIVSITKKRRAYQAKKISHFDILLLFRQLSTLLLAGIPISSAITILSQNTHHIKLSAMTTTIKEDIAAGNGLSFAMKRFPLYFDEMICNLVLAGEKSGTLDNMLEQISQHKEQLYLLKNKIKQALFYPTMILLVAIIVTLAMLIFVVPRFTDLFQNMHADLPTFTLYVMDVAFFIKTYWVSILFFIVVSVAGHYFAKRFHCVKLFLDDAILKLPIIGTSLQKFILARWSRSLATLFGAGIPITEALKMLTQSTGSMLYQLSIQGLLQHISAGKQMHTAKQHRQKQRSKVIQQKDSALRFWRCNTHIYPVRVDN